MRVFVAHLPQLECKLSVHGCLPVPRVLTLVSVPQIFGEEILEYILGKKQTNSLFHEKKTFFPPQNYIKLRVWKTQNRDCILSTAGWRRLFHGPRAMLLLRRR